MLDPSPHTVVDDPRVFVSEFDALLARDLRAVPLTLRPSLSTPARPWSPEARAAVLGVVLGLAVVQLVAAIVVLS